VKTSKLVRSARIQFFFTKQEQYSKYQTSNLLPIDSFFPRERMGSVTAAIILSVSCLIQQNGAFVLRINAHDREHGSFIPVAIRAGCAKRNTDECQSATREGIQNEV
jgi:hypothetical protein